MNPNFNWEYDPNSRHYIVRNTRMLFMNFSGTEQSYNAAGRRNFRLEVSEDLAEEMERQGIYVRTMEPRNEDEAPLRLLKISVYSDADIRLVNGRAMTPVVIPRPGDPETFDGGPMLDREFRKGYVANGREDGEICVEFHISVNTKVPNPKPYLRADIVIIPMHISKLAEEWDAKREAEDEPI